MRFGWKPGGRGAQTSPQRDIGLVRRLIRERSIESVFHFAGSIVVPDSVSDPLSYYANNTVTSRSLIRSAMWNYRMSSVIRKSNAVDELGIDFELGVRRIKDGRFGKCLCDENAVERVAMMRRKSGGVGSCKRMHGQFGKPALQRRRCDLLGRDLEVRPLQRSLDSDFPDAGRAEQHNIARGLDSSARGLAELAGTAQRPEQHVSVEQ